MRRLLSANVTNDSRWARTYASLLDDLRDLDEELLVLLGILAPYEHLHREFVALDLVEIFGYCLWSGLARSFVDSMANRGSAPFFWVVRMYRVSVVKSIRVVGNS